MRDGQEPVGGRLAPGGSHLQVDDSICPKALHREELQVPLEVLGVEAGNGKSIPKASLQRSHTGHKVSQGTAGLGPGRAAGAGEGTFLKQMGVGDRQGDCRQQGEMLDPRVLPRGLRVYSLSPGLPVPQEQGQRWPQLAVQWREERGLERRDSTAKRMGG